MQKQCSDTNAEAQSTHPQAGSMSLSVGPQVERREVLQFSCVMHNTKLYHHSTCYIVLCSTDHVSRCADALLLLLLVLGACVKAEAQLGGLTRMKLSAL